MERLRLGEFSIMVSQFDWLTSGQLIESLNKVILRCNQLNKIASSYGPITDSIELRTSIGINDQCTFFKEKISSRSWRSQWLLLGPHRSWRWVARR